MFPLDIFGQRFESFYDINVFLNYLWFIQIAICLLVCVKNQIHFPTKTRRVGKLDNALIGQFYIYLLVSSISYLSEMVLGDILVENFELFLHHFFAVLFFYYNYLEKRTMCTCYLVPFLLHSLYWIFVQDIILDVYNVSLMISIVLMLLKAYKRDTKLLSFRYFICIVLLFNSNMLGYFYGYGIKLWQLDYLNFVQSLVLSILVSSPFYIYLFLYSK